MLWYNPIVLNKMFRGILSLSLNLFYLETVAKGSKLNKTEENLKKSRRPTCCSPGSPAGLALLAQPTRGKVVFNLVPTGSQRTHPTVPPPASLCRALCQPNPAPGDASKPLSPLPHSLHSLPSSVPLPAAHPSTAVAAAPRLRSHRRRLA